jgi:hypothetical protein
VKLIGVNKLYNKFSFLNYIYVGAKLQMMLAIDFTNSNKSDTLHHMDESRNDYIQAIR